MPQGFLRSWVATHVIAVPAPERAERVAQWAASCMADAMMLGIPFDELQKAANGSLFEYISSAAQAASAATGMEPTD